MGLGAAIAGAAIVGAGASVISGNKAAGAVKDSAAQSDATNRYIYDTTRQDYAPYREVGTNALNKLAGLYGVQGSTPTPTPTTGVAGAFGGFSYNPATGQFTQQAAPSTQATTQQTTAPADPYGGFTATPGYQFRRDEALKAIERSASSRGALGSGATQKAMIRYADNNAASEFNTYADRLAALAGVGQSSTASVAAAGSNYAGQQTQTNMAAGQARASAYANTGSAINSGVQNLASAYLYNKGYGGGL
jgi:hypothetical protein